MAGRIALSWILVFFLTHSETNGRHLSDPVMQKHNISCIFQGKRKLICDFNGDHTCSVCPHFRDPELRSDHCPDSFSDGVCPVSQGRCLYDCGQYGYCREGHMIKLTPSGGHLPQSSSTCIFVDTKKHIQPGPVRDLTLTPVNGTTVKVTWRKPADRDNDEDAYKYTVSCTRHGIYPSTTIRSAQEELKVFCSYPSVSRVYSVTVKARPRRYGYWSSPRTATVSIIDEDLTRTSERDAMAVETTRRASEEDVKALRPASSSDIGSSSGSLRSIVLTTLIMVSIVCGVLLCTVVRSLCMGGTQVVGSRGDWQEPNQHDDIVVSSKVFLVSQSGICPLLKSAQKKVCTKNGSGKTTGEKYI